MIKELQDKAIEDINSKIHPTGGWHDECDKDEIISSISIIVSETALAVITHLETLLDSAGDNTWKSEMQDNVDKLKQEIKDDYKTN